MVKSYINHLVLRDQLLKTKVSVSCKMLRCLRETPRHLNTWSSESISSPNVKNLTAMNWLCQSPPLPIPTSHHEHNL